MFIRFKGLTSNSMDSKETSHLLSSSHRIATESSSSFSSLMEEEDTGLLLAEDKSSASFSSDTTHQEHELTMNSEKEFTSRMQSSPIGGPNSTALSSDSSGNGSMSAFSASTELEADNPETSEGGPPREVGHNLFILAHKLAKFNKELSLLIKSKECMENEALAYYAAHTAQIEIIREDRAMEQIVFPVPTICEYLTKETKQRIFLCTEKDEQNSKIPDFFNSVDLMWNEMKWQRKLRQQAWLYWFSSHMSLWSDISFYFAVLINLLVACFYPFHRGIKELDSKVNALIWTCLLISLSFIISYPNKAGIQAFIVSTILRMIYSLGLVPTLLFIGSINVINKGVFLVSYMGREGTFSHSFRSIFSDFELIYHILLFSLCIAGLCIHEFFYSILLLDVVYREETLLNVIRCFTKNAKSVLLTAVFAVILVYMFSIFGYAFLQNDFLMEVDPKTDGKFTLLEIDTRKI